MEAIYVMRDEAVEEMVLGHFSQCNFILLRLAYQMKV